MEVDNISIKLLPFRDEGLEVLKCKMLCPMCFWKIIAFSYQIPNSALAVTPTVSSNIVDAKSKGGDDNA